MAEEVVEAQNEELRMDLQTRTDRNHNGPLIAAGESLQPIRTGKGAERGEEGSELGRAPLFSKLDSKLTSDLGHRSKIYF